MIVSAEWVDIDAFAPWLFHGGTKRCAPVGSGSPGFSEVGAQLFVFPC